MTVRRRWRVSCASGCGVTNDVAFGCSRRHAAGAPPAESEPGPPAYPGGWDLQRDAFYAGLGGSGFALGPAAVLSRGVPAAPLRMVQRLREIIADRVSAVIPGTEGAFAVTLLTGFQNGMRSPITTRSVLLPGTSARGGGAAYRRRDGLRDGACAHRLRCVRACEPVLADQQLAAVAALAAGLGYMRC